MLHSSPKMALHWRKNLLYESAIFSNSDELFTPSEIITQGNNNVTPSTIGSNSSSPVLGLFALDFGLSASVDFQLFIKTFKNIAKNQILFSLSAAARKKAFNRPLKARNPDLSSRNLYMKSYYFCQKCEDHFKITKAKEYRYILFAAFFLKKKILFY